MRRALAFAFVCLLSPAPVLSGVEGPANGPAALIELAECHAFTEARLTEAARRLERHLNWTAAHQSLMTETRVHAVAAATLRRAMDDATRREMLAAYFPEGVVDVPSEARVERAARCQRVYAELRASARIR